MRHLRRCAFLPAVAFPLLLVACGSDPVAPSPQFFRETVVTVTGTVRSAADTLPISDAWVGIIKERYTIPNDYGPSHFRDTLDAALTDAAGAYSLQASVTHLGEECGFRISWGVYVHADGYSGTNDSYPPGTDFRLLCVDGLQVGDFLLEPLAP